MNVFNEHPFKVILDYGHNPAAVRAMCQLVERTPVRGRRLVALTMPGDRRDEDIAEVARIAATTGFDRYVVKRDDNQRGRKPDEVPRMIEAGLLAHGVAADRITLIPDEQEAVQAILEMAEPNDLVLVFADNVTRCWKQIIYFGRDPAAAAAAVAPAQPAEPLAPDDLPALDDLGQLPAGGTLIRDERGVRLARGLEESD
jgi:cyanophycin synthetase